MKRWIYGIVLLACLISICFLLAPHVSEAVLYQEQQKEIQTFRKSEFRGEKAETNTDPLYQQMVSYNESIFKEQQIGLKDAFSYEQNEFDLSELGSDMDMIGYLYIDKMNLEIPLYIGASNENLARGAAVLFQTSMPIGGKNTNCVIAGHRGYGGDLMFQNIEDLEKGDLIQIINPWAEITYRVYKCAVIEPSDIASVKIIEGQDMVTLCTCHPFGSNAQRYVVYALREEADAQSVPQIENGISYRSSKERIRLEKEINIAAIFLAGIFIIVLVVLLIKDIRKK